MAHLQSPAQFLPVHGKAAVRKCTARLMTRLTRDGARGSDEYSVLCELMCATCGVQLLLKTRGVRLAEVGAEFSSQNEIFFETDALGDSRQGLKKYQNITDRSRRPGHPDR
jgi:hypothetical protein